RLKDAGEPVVPVSINLSRLDFELCDVFAMIEGITQEYDMPKDMMEIEITESVLNDNIGFIRKECEKLKEAGYHIWLDDFGSGYSSLNTLTEYNFDVLKLDLVFLRSYDHNPKTAGLLTLIVKGAEQMGLEPLCEGVETKEHYEFLKKIGCTRAQGYYFGKPMPMEETRAHTRANGLSFESEETREKLKKTK
ncbi:MAG: EAL domain-containing protein, partial [Solobacterium sp.]|nr:EAL domain-containing protein [Solobacterium sp.]